MPHLAAGARFAFAIEMQAGAGLGEIFTPFAHFGSDQVHHFGAAEAAGLG
jgi:hypothetical protein